MEQFIPKLFDCMKSYSKEQIADPTAAANVKNGGRTPVAGMVHSVTLLLVLVVLMPYAAWIPMPAIAAILFMVACNSGNPFYGSLQYGRVERIYEAY